MSEKVDQRAKNPDKNKDKKILLVDDDFDYLKQQQIRFEQEGYTVFTADTEARAKEVFTEAAPDLVVLDLMMDHKDTGIVLSYAFKKSNPGVPVILVTGLTRETGMAFDMNSPGDRSWIKADRLLSKPVRFEQLRQEVEKLLAR